MWLESCESFNIFREFLQFNISCPAVVFGWKFFAMEGEKAIVL